MPVCSSLRESPRLKEKTKGNKIADTENVLETQNNVSPKDKKTQMSRPHGNQLKITSMFSSKRSRSPTNGECDIPKQKKSKLNILENKDEKNTDCNNTEESELSQEESKDDKHGTENEINNDCKHLEIDDNSNELNVLSKTSESIMPNKEKSSNGLTSSNEVINSDNIERLNENENLQKANLDLEKCDTCGQFLNNSDIIFYQGHPQNSIEEFIALTNDKLTLSAGDDGDIMERPQTNITGFSIFDHHGHLCPIDGGLIESDVRIYMSGYLKSICSDSPDIDDDSIPVKDVGPIIEWFIHGFDGGTKNCITLSTEFGEYNLLKPSAEYTPLMDNLYEKIYLSKVVVEYLEEYHYLQPTYEELLEIVRESTIPELNDKRMTEELLHKHAQFVCDQVVTLEADDDAEPLITLPCMRELIKLLGIKFGKRKIRPKINYKKVDKKAWTKATTTPLVRKTFESFFTNQLDKTNHELVLRRKRCGICEACQLPDCGQCNACRAMAKFGGHGRTKKACVRRLCPNMAVEQAEDSDPDDEEEYRQMAEKKEHDKIDETVPVKLTGTNNRKIKWVGEPTKADATKVYYEKVQIDDAELMIGDFVMLETSQANIPALVAKVTYMWKESINPKAGYFHGEVFIRSSDTVLGECGDPREVFLADRCCHGAPLSSILRKANVERKNAPSDWFRLGGKEVDEEFFEDDGKTYYYKKYYERFTARFEDIPEDPVCPNALRKHRFCPSCERKTKRDALDIPRMRHTQSIKNIYR